MTDIAALVSVGAPPASYTANFGAAEEFGVEPEKVLNVEIPLDRMAR